jgi:hypothetical protein
VLLIQLRKRDCISSGSPGNQFLFFRHHQDVYYKANVTAYTKVYVWSGISQRLPLRRRVLQDGRSDA